MNTRTLYVSAPTAMIGAGATAMLASASAPPIAGREAASSAAQGADGSSAPGGATPAPSPFGSQFLLILLALFGVMIFMQVMAGRKEKKKRQELLSSLARHDRVQTVGGIIGAIAEVRPDYVVLKVDESTNTKIRVARSAVQQVLKKSGVREPETVEQPEPVEV